MTWPLWLSAPESFCLGAFLGFVVALYVTLAWLDRGRRYPRVDEESS